jgi:hypothetical protein
VILYVSEDVKTFTKACLKEEFRAWVDKYLSAPITCMAVHSRYTAQYKDVGLLPWL